MSLIINSDFRRILQILVNLLDNALKFTIQGSVKVLIEYINEENKIQIKVTDTGI